MLTPTFTLFTEDTLQDWVVYDGHLENYALARRSGHLAYMLSTRLSMLALNSVPHIADDDDDDATIAPIGNGLLSGLRGPGGQISVIATIDYSVSRKTLITGLGRIYQAQRRSRRSGWKFTDEKGLKYKWEVVQPMRHWELCSERGDVVATFTSTMFWKREPGYLAIHSDVDATMQSLILVSWGLTAKTFS
ncbi:hypothetical protein FBU59_001248 [Linderina macrospora]|uniref:Uncharacterized protein n=1 Tax=Linderina macrospora TaxID=4868 RepID=A0ACC1JEK9_9FUNG|nr:hypothetical protein FBU59_001248 [Linderina macrospora]